MFSSPAAGRGSFFYLSPRELALAFLGFGALSVLYYLPVVTDPITFASADLTMFFIPFRQTWVEQARLGLMPLWDPYTSSGTPLLAMLQPAVLYPLSVFYLWFSFFWVFKLTIVLHYGLAGFSMYWLMRGAGCGRMGAAIAGFGFMFGGYLFSLKHYLSSLLPVAWAPLLILCFFAGVVRRDRRLALAAAGVAALMFLAGGVETCYQVIPWLILFALLPLPLQEPDRSLPGLKFRIGYLTVFLAAFGGLIAVQFLPTWELTQHSQRAGGYGLAISSQWGMKWRDLIQFFLLDPHGYLAFPRSSFTEQVWLRALYVGGAPFLLAGFFLLRGGWRVWALGLVGIASLGVALGVESPLYLGFHEYLPFFDRFRYPIKFILPLILVIAMASAWGWEAFCRRAADSKTDSTRIRWTLLWLAAAGMIGVGIVDAGREFLTSWLMGSGIHPPDYNAPSINLSNLQRLLGFTSLFAFTLFLALRVRRGRAWCLRAAVGVFFLDIFFSVQGMYLTTPTGMLEKNSPATEFLQSDPDLFRVFVTPQSEKSATGRDLKREVRGNKIRGGSLPMEFRNWPGMYQVGGWNVLRKNKLIDFIEILQTPPLSARLPLLRMANVKYVVHAGAVPLGSLPLGFQDPSSNMPAEAADGADLNDRFSTRIYRNPGWLGRAYLVGACRVVTPDSAGWREALLDPGFDPVRQVVLEKSPTELPCTEDGPGELGAGAVTFLEVQPARTVLRVESAKKQFLLLSDSFFPGWEAEVDGTRVEILRANLAYRAIVMPAGGHEVVFTYRPGSFTLGLGITCLTLVLVGAGWLWETRQRPAPAPARAQSRETDFTVRPPGRGIIEDQATGAQASSP